MKKVSLFDVRNIIGALMVIYGVILLLTSFATSEADKAKADGINANLWVGIALLIFGILMVTWAVTRPIVVDEAQLEADTRAVEEAAGRRVDDEGGAGGVG
jgi:NADH:ubiquinone oxidoreductase subunit 6 (subunit J)